MADVHIPGVGDVDKKYVYVAGGVVVLIVGYKWWQARNTPVAIDPATGLPYGSTSDQYSYQASSGSNSGYQPYPVDQYGNALPAPIYSQNPSVQTNQEWLSAAESLQIGVSDTVLVAALSKILGGIPVTQDQIDIWNQVTGIIGTPPQGAPSPRLKIETTPTPTPVGDTFEYVVQLHQIGAQTQARDLVRRYSDSAVATPDRVEVALRKTVGDPANSKYRQFYASHGGAYPAQAAIHVWVVRRKG